MGVYAQDCIAGCLDVQIGRAATAMRGHGLLELNDGNRFFAVFSCRYGQSDWSMSGRSCRASL